MKLNAQKREVVGKKVKQLRQNGEVPSTMYGPKTPSTNIKVNSKDLKKVYKQAGNSKFIDIEVEGGKAQKVLIKEINFHPILDYVIDASFYAVDEDRKITVEVPINLIGEAPAVKQKLGFLVQQTEALAVYCLPKDLPGNFDVDISGIETTSDSVSISDIELPEGVELDSNVDPSSAIAYIATAQKEEEVEETDEEGEEGEEGAEGEEGEEKAEGGEKPEGGEEKKEGE